jgi:hypothetical protein
MPEFIESYIRSFGFFPGKSDRVISGKEVANVYFSNHENFIDCRFAHE